MHRILVALLIAGLSGSTAAVDRAPVDAGAGDSNNALDDRSVLPPEQAYRPTLQAYVVAVGEGQGLADVQRAAAEVIGAEAKAEPLFASVDAEDDPEGLARLYRVSAPRARDSGAQWDAAYRLKETGAFEAVEPDTETAIEEGRKRQAATAGCLTNAGVPFPDSVQWSLDHMRVREARTLVPPDGGVTGGEGVRICHPDSGWTDHVDLDKARIDTRHSLNLMEGGTDATDPLGYPGHPGHGTGTGSVIMSSGGFDASGKPTGPGSVNGLAHKATLVPIRAFKNVIHVFDSDIAKAVQHASRAQCDVISMSLGGKGFIGLEKAIKDAIRRDIIVVSAAGNCAGIVVAPASYPSVIAVAATNAARRPWPGSSQGKAVDISAPGEDVWVARAVAGASPATKVDWGDGTSFATAAVAGAAANWVGFHGRDRIKTAQAGQTRQRLFMLALSRSAAPGPDWDNKRMGAGILDLHKLLSQDLPSGASLFAVPAQFDYATVLAERFDLERSAVVDGLKRMLRHPEDFDAMLEAYGAELVDIATRHPDAFRAAARPVPAGAFVVPPTLVQDAGSQRLKLAAGR